MRFVSTREVRNNPSEFRETVEQEDVVLTANGKPFAIAVGVEEDDLAETMDLLRQLRALRAMARMQKSATERGLNTLSEEEIEEEIRAARRERKERA